jgi:hypothetical protein
MGDPSARGPRLRRPRLKPGVYLKTRPFGMTGNLSLFPNERAFPSRDKGTKPNTTDSHTWQALVNRQTEC